MSYASHWRLAYIAAFFLHLGLWLFFSLALPRLLPAPEMGGEVVALEWAAEEAEPAPSAEGSPLAASQEPPQPAAPEPAAPTAAPEEAVAESSPVVADSIEAAIATLKQEEVKDTDLNADKKKKRQEVIIVKGGSGQQLGEPPKVVTDFYPAPDIVDFRGRVSVLATINKQGVVSEVKIAITSGRMLVDAVAKDAVRRWTFKPALDMDGKPMECVKVISIPFNVPRRR